ncbi:hypothetical protein Pelo_14340 [Pelomyxa schiedti]|nr:hypothetical protein Pelo_14340 [Pelomyxa schiedti]
MSSWENMLASFESVWFNGRIIRVQAAFLSHPGGGSIWVGVTYPKTPLVVSNIKCHHREWICGFCDTLKTLLNPIPLCPMQPCLPALVLAPTLHNASILDAENPHSLFSKTMQASSLFMRSIGTAPFG